MVILGSVFVFIVAGIIRLLDNSAGLLIASGISVSPFYLSADTIKEEIQKLEGSNEKLERKLYRNIKLQKLHKVLIIVAVVLLLVGIVYEIYNKELIRLL
jgi:hypothetical protein